jgi:hypothetical protein
VMRMAMIDIDFGGGIDANLLGMIDRILMLDRNEC